MQSHAGDTISVVRLVGEFDLSRKEELWRTLSALSESGAVLIDLEAVPYIDSTALSCFVALKTRMAQHGGVVAFSRVSRSIERLFNICGLDKVFPLYESVEEGEAALRNRSPSGSDS
jgi:anti-sigma B factor antagonist